MNIRGEVVDYLCEEKIPFTTQKCGTIVARLSGKSGTYESRTMVSEEGQIMLSFTDLGVLIPVNRRSFVSEFLTRVNWNLALGTFKTHMDTGELGLEIIQLVNEEFSWSEIHRIFEFSIHAIDVHFPAIMAIAFGNADTATAERMVLETGTVKPLSSKSDVPDPNRDLRIL